MYNHYFSSCVLSLFVFFSCHLAVPAASSDEDTDSVPFEQIEQTEQVESLILTDSTVSTVSNPQADTTAVPTVAIAKKITLLRGVPKKSPSIVLKRTAVVTPKPVIVTSRQPLVIDGLVLTEDESKVFELTNAERAKRGLPALRLSRRLMESARRQANWMSRTGIFKHGNSGYAENIAMGQRSSREVVIDWMNSVGHFRNMMNRNHGEIGIGCCYGKNGTLFWCQQFSR